jgi:hypothetical protein
MVTMNVTLKLEDELVTRAEALAAAKHMTVSQMLERLLRVAAEPLKPEELPPITRSVAGMLPPMTDAEANQALDEAKERKYGK